MTRFDLRQLGLDDMDRAALVHRTSFDARLPWLKGLHTPEEDRWFYRERIYPACTVWGAFDGDGLVGIAAFREGWIDQLYVLPHAQGQGVGTALLAAARARGKAFSVWTFQRNEGARRFYERHHFIAVQDTDGSENEEHEPAVLYHWAEPERASPVRAGGR